MNLAIILLGYVSVYFMENKSLPIITHFNSKLQTAKINQLVRNLRSLILEGLTYLGTALALAALFEFLLTRALLLQT